MTERPILFSGPMVKAILEGRKTMTRRVIKLPAWAEAGQKHEFEIGDTPGQGQSAGDWPFAIAKKTGCLAPIECPYGVPGDRLWIKETFLPVVGQNDKGESGWFEWVPENKDDEDERPEEILYRATDDVHPKRWRPSIFMPRWASRINLEVTKVRVERLQEISEEDALAEGVEPYVMTQEDIDDLQISDRPPREKELGRLMGPGQFTAKFTYNMLWEELNKARGFGWATNPWVWVIEFKRLESNQ